jgi:hypothetical protein
MDAKECAMSKSPIDEKYLQKIVETTQSIEGYTKASKEAVKKVKILREKYGIKVSAKK